VAVVVEAPAEVAAAVEAHRDFVAAETLATSVSFGDAGDAAFAGEAGEDVPVRVAVSRS
jgi:isoleucyl-tRNA synthetase